MADWTSLYTQIQQTQQLALSEATQQAKLVHAAYLGWAQGEDGQVMLADLCAVLLHPCETPVEEGERRMVLKILKRVREAPARLKALEEGHG